MESFNQKNNVTPENPTSKEGLEKVSPEITEYVPKFEHIKEDLKNLFQIEATSEASLAYPWVKDEMYTKIIEDFNAGKPFALDYLFKEGLLTKEDLISRGIQANKERALQILQSLRGPRLFSVKELFIDTGLLTQEEIDSTPVV